MSDKGELAQYVYYTRSRNNSVILVNRTTVKPSEIRPEP